MNCLPGNLLAGGDGHRYFIRKNAVKIEENSRHIVTENKTGLLFTLIEHSNFGTTTTGPNSFRSYPNLLAYQCVYLL